MPRQATSTGPLVGPRLPPFLRKMREDASADKLESHKAYQQAATREADFW